MMATDEPWALALALFALAVFFGTVLELRYRRGACLVCGDQHALDWCPAWGAR